MENTILFLCTIIPFLFLTLLMYRKVKKLGDMIELIAYIILAASYSTITIIYYLDRYNIPTQFGLNINVNTQNWLEIIWNYIAVMLNAGISIGLTVTITKYQIKKNNEDNSYRDKENLRIQNMPMLKYEIKTESNKDNYEINIDNLIISNYEGTEATAYDLFISIKNIGLNNVKRMIVDFESSIAKNTYRIIGKETIVPIEKGESKDILV